MTTAHPFDADVIIVGGGPAGLSAALVLGRACRNVILFDHGRPRNAASHAMHGFLSRDGLPPAEFRQIAREQLRPYTTVHLEHGEVLHAMADAGGFRVTLTDGRSATSQKLLLATGVMDRLPDVPGLLELYGRSIFHCPYCDGWEVRDQPLAVYGCDRRGYGLALELTGWSHDIVLCSDGACGLDGESIATLLRQGIQIREDRIARLEGHDGQLAEVVFDNGERLARRAIFFTTGQIPCSELAVKLGCALNAKGTVDTGRHETTEVPGLYIAGDASHDLQWVVVAAAEGAKAAYDINQALIEDRLK